MVRAAFALLFVLFFGCLFVPGIGFLFTLEETKPFIESGAWRHCLHYRSFSLYLWTGIAQFGLGVLFFAVAAVVGLVKERSGAGIALILTYVLLIVLYRFYSGC